MAWVEQVGKRGQKHKVFFDADTNTYRSEVTVHDRHYRNDQGDWQDVDEALVDDGQGGFAKKCEKTRHTFRVANAGSRRWYPRRNVAEEYVDLTNLQYFQNIWRNLNLPPPAWSGNGAEWDLANIYASITNTWKRIKTRFILKDNTAPTGLRFEIALVGLTFDGWNLVSTTDATVVGSINPPTAEDANGADVPVTAVYDGTYIEWQVNTAGATFPIDVDPTFTDGPSGDVDTGKDTTIMAGTMDNNYGARVNLHMRGVSDIRKALIEFDLSSIASDQVCTSATLYTYTFTGTGTGDGTVRSIAVGNDAWIEGASDGAASNGEPTWRRLAHNVANWAGSSGLETATTDYETTVLGTFSHAADADGTEKAISLSTSRVQSWFGATNTNYGLLLTADGAYYLYIHSAESVTEGDRPKLVVEYTEPEAPAPTPSLPGAPSAPGSVKYTRPIQAPFAPHNIRPVIYTGNLFSVASGKGLGVEFNTRLSGDEIPGYSHEITATGGYWAAAVSGEVDEKEVPFWLANGLGRHVEVFDGIGSKIWVGFVNDITINIGGAAITIGPLKEVVNRVRVKYTTVRYNTNPPIGGDEALTDWVEDTDSQDKYGLLSEEVSGGEMNDTEADNLALGYLETYKRPQVSKSISLSGTNQVSVQLGLLGYVHYLDFFHYTNTPEPYTSASGVISIAAKLAAILDADPNGLFSSANSDLDDAPTSTLTDPVSEYEEAGGTGLSIISDIAERGDVSGNRYFFTVYENQKFTYEQLEENGEDYHYGIRDSRQVITRRDGSEVFPWQVRPGKWLFVTDFNYANTQSVSLKDDYRAMFIESVRYTAPFGLQLEGGRVRGLNQTLARKTGIISSGTVSYGGGNPFSAAGPHGPSAGFAHFYSLFGNFVPPRDIGPPAPPLHPPSLT